MARNTCLTSLSPQRQALLHQLQRINFGRIERLVIRQGQPQLEPAPIIIREVKFGGENGARPEHDLEDFALKAEVVELFTMFDDLHSGVIDSLQIKHGLPFLVWIRETTA